MGNSGGLKSSYSDFIQIHWLVRLDTLLLHFYRQLFIIYMLSTLKKDLCIHANTHMISKT